MSLEERVRRKLILAGIVPKLSNLGQGMIGEAIEAAGAGQFGRLHKEALDDSSICDDIRNVSFKPSILSRVRLAIFLSLTARDASTKPNVHRIAVQLRSKDVGLTIGSVLFSFMVDVRPG